MATERELNNRIRSIRNISQVTSALAAVSAVKATKAQHLAAPDLERGRLDDAGSGESFCSHRHVADLDCTRWEFPGLLPPVISRITYAAPAPTED